VCVQVEVMNRLIKDCIPLPSQPELLHAILTCTGGRQSEGAHASRDILGAEGGGGGGGGGGGHGSWQPLGLTHVAGVLCVCGSGGRVHVSVWVCVCVYFCGWGG